MLAANVDVVRRMVGGGAPTLFPMVSNQWHHILAIQVGVHGIARDVTCCLSCLDA